MDTWRGARQVSLEMRSWVVFGYLSSQSLGSRAAVEFALDLVTLGQKLLLPFAEGMNEIIPTGTRVGIATGDIWPLNIGRKDLELSFVGAVIKFAARLEKNFGCR